MPPKHTLYSKKLSCCGCCAVGQESLHLNSMNPYLDDPDIKKINEKTQSTFILSALFLF